MTPPKPPLHALSDDDLLQALARAARALPLPPAALQRAAVGLYAASQVTSETSAKGAAQALLRRIVAALSFDSWAAPALAVGLRSVRSPARHLLFSAQGRDIDLRITPAADDFALAGQVLGPDSSGMVTLVHETDGLHQARVTQLDDLGEFRIQGVRRGVHVMTLRLGSDEILLPPIEVGDGAP